MARKTKIRKFNDKNLDELIRLYKAGDSIEDLKRRFHCNGNPLVARLKKAKVYRKARGRKAPARRKLAAKPVERKPDPLLSVPEQAGA